MARPAPWWKKLAWLIGLWCAGVGALALLAAAIGLLLRAAGRHS